MSPSIGLAILRCIVVGFGLTASAAFASDAFDDPQAWDFHDAPLSEGIEHPDWFTMSFLNLREDLEDAVAEGKQGLVVYFGQRHCAYCKALMEVNFRKPDILHAMQTNFNVVAIDIWGSREIVTMDGHAMTEREFAVSENTNFTPSLIFYDAQGREALRLRGYYQPYRFRAALDYVLDDYYQDESFREYLTRANPPPKFELGDLNEREFFSSPPHMLDRSRFAAQQPLVVFFEQRDCFACDVLHGDPLANSQTQDLIREFEAVQLDMWSDERLITPEGKRKTAESWAEEMDLFYAPTLVFFDERGREIIRLDSLVRLYRLRGVLEYVLTKGYLESPNYQRWRQDRDDAVGTTAAAD